MWVPNKDFLLTPGAAAGVPRIPPVWPRGALCPLPAQDEEPDGAWWAAADQSD